MGAWELKIIRERSQQLKDGTLRSRGDALLPIMLASYLFDVLVVVPGKIIIYYCYISIKNYSYKYHVKEFLFKVKIQDFNILSFF